MKRPQQLIKTITQWAKSREDIRALILIGSYAKRGKTDHLSDIDLCFFVADPAAYVDRMGWLHELAPVRLAFSEGEGEQVIVRAMHEGDVMVEYIFMPLSALDAMQERLPLHFEPGYQILVDKDRRARKLPKAGGGYAPPEPPTPEIFINAVHRFWFHAHQVAKYLRRGELWRAKHYDWQLKQQLLHMMGWHAAQVGKQSSFTTYEGKRLQEWVEPGTTTALMAAFGRFYPADSWRALDETMKIFTRLAKELAQSMNFRYPQQLQEHLIALIDEMRSNPK